MVSPSTDRRLVALNPSLRGGKVERSLPGTLRRTAFWAHDRFFNRGLVRNQYKDLLEIAESPPVGRRRVAGYVETLVAHATATTRFYGPYAGKSLDELPVATKLLYREDYESFLSSAYRGVTLHTQSTSGSTGMPFSVVQNMEKRNRVIAELKLYARYAGHESHEKLIYLKVLTPRTVRPWLTCLRENIWRVDCSHLGPENLDRIRQTLKKAGRITLFAYPTTLDALAQHLIDRGDTSADFNIRAIISGGEALQEVTRKRLKDVFECSITSRYSSEEMGVLGQDSDADRSYYLNWGSYYFECLKLDSDEPAAQGEVGRVVITDLFNFAFPMVRYDTGDLGMLDGESEHGWPRLRELYGKHRDVVYDTRGNLISPVVLSFYLWGLEGVKQFQFIQETEKDFVLRLNGVKHPTVAEKISLLKTVLGGDANIVSEYVDEIPVLSSHKRQYIVCKIKNRRLN
jgi:phenylacetate-CoA ligase